MHTSFRYAFLIVVVASLVGCGGTSGSGNDSDSGIRGMTVVSPTCPVEQTSDPCEPQGVAADVAVHGGSHPSADSAVVAEESSSSDGTFSIGVAPGEYVVTATVSESVPMPQTQEVHVTVADGTFTEITITFDSGIRTGTSATQ